MGNEEGHPKERTWLAVLSVIVVPFIISLLTSYATRDANNRQIQAHFVELAISILNTAPRADKTDVPLRKWAAAVVNDYSGVKLSAAAAQDLTDAPLPSSPVVSQAALLERQGFDALSQGNVASARRYFSQTDSVYPGYHSAAEIVKYLQTQPGVVTDNATKQKIVNTILTKYSWHVPRSNLNMLIPQSSSSTSLGSPTRDDAPFKERGGKEGGGN